MEYSVISVTDGNNVVRAEHITDLENARKTWHHWCELLISDKSFTKGMVKLVDTKCYEWDYCTGKYL